jgi:hypothetical protein
MLRYAQSSNVDCLGETKATVRAEKLRVSACLGDRPPSGPAGSTGRETLPRMLAFCWTSIRPHAIFAPLHNFRVFAQSVFMRRGPTIQHFGDASPPV